MQKSENQDATRKNRTSSFTRIFKNQEGTTGYIVLEQTQGINSDSSNSSQSIDIKNNSSLISISKEQLQQTSAITDEYQLGKTFAEGGQGIIRHGTDKHLGRIVAIKTLKKEVEDEETRSQFLQEAAITARLSHPAIVPIYSLNSDKENGLHISMKLIQGQTLKDYLNKIAILYKKEGFENFNETKSLKKRLGIFLQVCNALEYAHSQNIMHCDLKPENIFIGDYHETYLMDWGIAREIIEPGYDPEKWTTPSTISGTPRFLSPEAIHGMHTDQRADIYTMGLILFEIVTFQEAYTGVSNDEVVSKIRNGRMATLRHKFGFKIDKDLRAIIRKATAFEREERYQNIKDLITDIQQYLMGRETSANPYYFHQKILSKAIQHKKTTMFVSIFFIVFLLFFTGYIFLKEKKYQEKSEKINNVITSSLFQSKKSADHLDTNFGQYIQTLTFLVDEYSFLAKGNLNDSVADKEPIYSMPDMEPNSPTSPKTAQYSGIYYRRVDFNHFSYKTVDMKPTTEEDKACLRRLNRLNPIFLNLFKKFLEKEPNASLLEWDEQKNYLCSVGIPFHNILFGFKSGLYAAVPGRSGYAASYDPRTRLWYTKEKKGIVWTKPYPGISFEAGCLISCSSSILDDNEEQLGVVAIDIRLKNIIDYLNVNGNKGKQVIEKTLVNQNGDVILSTGSEFNEKIKNTKEGSILLSFCDMELLQDAIKNKISTKLKTFKIQGDDGKSQLQNRLYCINYLADLDWYYIEIINMDIAMR